MWHLGQIIEGMATCLNSHISLDQTDYHPVYDTLSSSQTNTFKRSRDFVPSIVYIAADELALLI